MENNLSLINKINNIYFKVTIFFIFISFILFIEFNFLKPNILPENSEKSWDSLRTIKNYIDEVSIDLIPFFSNPLEDKMGNFLNEGENFHKKREPSLVLDLSMNICSSTTGDFEGRKTPPHKGIFEDNC